MFLILFFVLCVICGFMNHGQPSTENKHLAHKAKDAESILPATVKAELLIKERENAEKAHQKALEAQHKRELALADMERFEALKADYIRLLDAIEGELKNCTEKRRVSLLSKLVSVEQKVHNLDHKIESAYYAANADCIIFIDQREVRA